VLGVEPRPRCENLIGSSFHEIALTNAPQRSPFARCARSAAGRVAQAFQVPIAGSDLCRWITGTNR
jgi:hypothetical protein